MTLPKYELYELGSQLRRSADSTVTNIVEGYGRRSYKADFIKFLVYAHASNIETLNHLEKLKILYPDKAKEAGKLVEAYDVLGAQLYSFIQFVKRDWKSDK